VVVHPYSCQKGVYYANYALLYLLEKMICDFTNTKVWRSETMCDWAITLSILARVLREATLLISPFFVPFFV
jgi:hypothetical protein